MLPDGPQHRPAESALEDFQHRPNNAMLAELGLGIPGERNRFIWQRHTYATLRHEELRLAFSLFSCRVSTSYGNVRQFLR